MSVLFAATYPERTAALVLRNGFRATMWAPDYPWGRTEEQYRARGRERAARSSGRRSTPSGRGRDRQPGRRRARAFADYLRYGASPGRSTRSHRMNTEIDVRHVLPSIRVPTLVLHGTQDAIVAVGGRPLDGRAHPGAPARRASRRGPSGRSVRHGRWRGRDRAVPDGGLGVRRLGGRRAGPRARDRPLHGHRRLDREGGRARRPRAGASCSSSTTRWSAASSCAFAARRSTPPATASSRASTGRRARSAARARSPTSVRELGLEVRAGLHTGECELVDGKVGGIAVHIGARVASRPSRARCSSRAPSRTSSPARA